MKRLRLFIAAFLLAGPVLAEVRDFTVGGNIDFGNTRNSTTQDLQLCAWVKTSEDASSDFIAGKKNNVTTAAGYSLDQNSSDFLNARVADGTDDATCNDSVDTDAKWIFACTDWNNATTTVTLWVNTTANFPTTSGCTNTDALVGNLSNSVSFRMGADGAGGNGANALATQVQVWLGMRLSEAERNEAQYKPGMVANPSDANWGYFPSFGTDSPEPSAGGPTATGTVTTAVKSQDGPPIMFAGGLPL